MQRGWEWAAGLFEGEGCITRRLHTQTGEVRGVRLQIDSTDLDVLEEFQRIVKFGTVRPQRSRDDNHKFVWRWACTALVEVTYILENLLPYLCQRRRDKAREALIKVYEMQSVRTGWFDRKVTDDLGRTFDWAGTVGDRAGMGGAEHHGSRVAGGSDGSVQEEQAGADRMPVDVRH